MDGDAALNRQQQLERRQEQFGYKVAGGRRPAQNPLQNLLMAGSFLPGIGDASGLGADALMFKNEPDSRTLGNAALAMLGMLPFVPNAAATKKVVDSSIGRLVPKDKQSLFVKLADDQRGAPEIAMKKVQIEAGGGVVSFVSEHVGDLTHRMSERSAIDGGQMGYGYVKDKVKKTLRTLKNKYGFAREHGENLMANAPYRKLSPEELKRNVDLALSEYAAQHKKLRVHNVMQMRARDAAVAIGEQRWDDAIEDLTQLEFVLDKGPDMWVKHASKVEF